jgi:hypothetical protein
MIKATPSTVSASCAGCFGVPQRGKSGIKGILPFVRRTIGGLTRETVKLNHNGG